MITDEAILNTINVLYCSGQHDQMIVADALRELLKQQMLLDEQEEKRHNEIINEIGYDL